MGLTIFTVVFNTILDPIFIFVFDMGIAGAAWATVLSQTIAMLYVMWHFNNRERAIHFDKGILRLHWKVAKNSLVIGMGPFLMHAAACIVTLFINQQLRQYSGDLGIGAYGICNRFIFMFIMICLGLNQGMQPIAGYNYGARLYSRVKDVFWRTAKHATIVTTICFAIGMFIPRTAVGIFTHDPELMEIASNALKILTVMFPFVGFQMIGTNFFQSLGMVKKSVFLSLSRQILFLLPSLYLLPMAIGTDGVWYSFTISDSLSFLLTAILIRQLFKKFNRLKDGEDPGILGSNI
jgi:putative MATE family efflux protein